MLSFIFMDVNTTSIFFLSMFSSLHLSLCPQLQNTDMEMIISMPLKIFIVVVFYHFFVLISRILIGFHALGVSKSI